MNRQIISLSLPKCRVSIDLSIRPRGHSHCDYLFADRAQNSLKHGEKSYCIAYFNKFYLTFSQNRVKIGPKFIL